MTTQLEKPAPPAPKFRASSLLRARELGIALVIVIVFVVTTVNNGSFASGHSVQQLLTGASLIALLGVGETLVIVTRNVDLSVGSVVGISAYLVGDMFKHHPGMPVILGFLLGIGIGAVIGAVNGLITSVAAGPEPGGHARDALHHPRRRRHDRARRDDRSRARSPAPSSRSATATVFGVPWLAIIVARGRRDRRLRDAHVPVGRDLYAIGSNPRGRRTRRHPDRPPGVHRFLISGALAGFAGALFLALHAQIDVTGGTGYELTVVAAVVVGGVAIFGGSGTVLGAALGALLLNTINQALVASRISAFWNDAIAGALLLAAIAFDRWLSLRVTRSLQSARGSAPRCLTSSPSRRRSRRTTPGWTRAGRHHGAALAALGGRRWSSSSSACILFGAGESSTFLSTNTLFFAGLNMGEIAHHGAAAAADRDDRRDRPVGRLDARPVRRRDGPPVPRRLRRSGSAMLVALLVGAVGGALNGVLVARLRLPSIAVTIGTLTLFRGLAEILLARTRRRGRFPRTHHRRGHPRAGGRHLPLSAIDLHRAGRRLRRRHCTRPRSAARCYAIGLQPEAAQFSGIRVDRIKFWLYVLSGVLCSFAGILFTLKNASASYSAGLGLELTVVAIVLFGGVSIFGGRGTVVGVVLSVIIVGALQQALTQMNVQARSRTSSPAGCC